MKIPFFGERRLPACSGRQLGGYILRTLVPPKRRANFIRHLGKLPRYAGWQPALPRSGGPAPSVPALDPDPDPDPIRAIRKIRSRIMIKSKSARGPAPFSARPLSLPMPRHFRHSSPPYALVSANVRSAKQTPAFCARHFGDRGHQPAIGGRRQPGWNKWGAG
jgi:hypothetical protein